MPSPWYLNDVMMFIQDEGIIVNKLIEVLIKGLDYRERTERSEKRQSYETQ